MLPAWDDLRIALKMRTEQRAKDRVARAEKRYEELQELRRRTGIWTDDRGPNKEPARPLVMPD